MSALALQRQPERLLETFEHARMGGKFSFRESVWQGRAMAARRRHHGPSLFLRPTIQRQSRLAATTQLQIDRRQQFTVEKCSVQAAGGEVDAETAAEGVEAGLCTGKAPTGKGHRIEGALGWDKRIAQKTQFSIEEAKVELGIVNDQNVFSHERQEIFRDLLEAGLVGQELGGEAVNLEGFLRHVALGVDIVLP